MNPTPTPYRFHAFDVSYFSGKVRPALRYKGLWFEERRANIREILKRTGLTFIPILESPAGEVWQDSTDIFDRLEERHPEPPLFPHSPVQDLAARLVELYVDEFGMMPAMHYRWGSELGEASARARFGAMVGSVELGNQAADRMVKARFSLGATPETGPAIEAHTRDLLDALSAHFERHPYLLGSRLSFADCALMGMLYAHLFVDLVSRKLLLETAVPVVGWIERCNAPHADEQGDWLADDPLAQALRPVLEAMGSDAAPVILEAMRTVEAWADDRPSDLESLPRGVGSFKASLRGTSFERAAIPYVLLSVQRVADAYQALDWTAREAVDDAVAGTGWEELLAYTPRHRVKRQGFELVFETSD